MKRSYADGWNAVFGDSTSEPAHNQDVSKPSQPKPAETRTEKSRVEPPIIKAEEIDWKQTRPLSIRQPWAELIMLGVKKEECRSGPTKIRGRIAIYASLSKEDLPEAKYHGLDQSNLPRGEIVGTVELYDCDGFDWKLRRPMRLSKPIKPTKHPQPVWFYPFGRS